MRMLPFRQGQHSMKKYDGAMSRYSATDVGSKHELGTNFPSALHWMASIRDKITYSCCCATSRTPEEEFTEKTEMFPRREPTMTLTWTKSRLCLWKGVLMTS